MSTYSVVLITVPDAKTAEKVSTQLLEAKLAACVNQVPGVKSRYWWEGKIETADEALLVVKTRSNLVGELSLLVKSIHPYSVPEIIALPIAEGHAPYLNWIGANTRFSSSPEQPKNPR